MAEQTVYAIESYGSRYFGMKITVDQERKLDDEDYSAVYKHVMAIQHLIQGRTLKLDPQEQANAAEERTKLLACFPEPIFVTPVRNQYHLEDSAYGQMHPWFDVTTKRGIFLVGWRKRVINLDWSRTDIKTDGNVLFADQQVTKDKTYIHAYGYERCKGYVDQLMAAP